MKKITLIISLIIVFVLLMGINVNINAVSGSNTMIWVDTPEENQTLEKGRINIQGWIMSESRNAEVEILLDGATIESEISRQERSDVINAISGYGGKNENPTPGYIAQIDISNISDGNHVLTIRALNEDKTVILGEQNINFKVGIYNTLIWIDSPSEGSIHYQQINVAGWVMSDYVNNQIKVLIDGQEKNVRISRQARPDVISAIDGYGGNLNTAPGYTAQIDISELTSGTHTFTLNVQTEEGHVISTTSTNFNVKKADTLLQYDTPKENERVKTNLEVQGWVMSEDTDNIVEIQFNGTTYQTERQSRQDVINAINGYGDDSNRTPGYKAEIDTRNINDGTYPVTVVVKSQNGEILIQDTRNIIIRKYDTLLQFDTPQNNEKVKTKLTVQGWVLSEYADNVVQIELNGQIYETTRQSRTDIFESIDGFGGRQTNPTPGYIAEIDTSNIKDGTYNVTINVLNTSENVILATETRRINIKKYEGIINIDYPQVTMINDDTLDIQGWVMTEDANATLRIYIDNQLLNTTDITRQERPDVINAISGYGTINENPRPGYKITANISGYSEGRHTINVVAISRTGDTIASGEKRFTIYRNEYFGIDISEHQSTVNFEALVNTNQLDFMIARVGWYSESRDFFEVDDQFERNYTLAKQYNIPLGTYLYSYATNVQEAKNEANALVNYLKGKQMSFELPVFYDIEDPSQYGASKDEKTQMCVEFCEILKQAGYDVGIYSSRNWLTNYIDLARIPNDYSIWVAGYGTNDGLPQDPAKFPGNHDIWQYTSSGTIDGIAGNVDFNICYKKYW